MTDAPAEGDRLPDVTLIGADGSVSLAALRANRPLVVAFYSEDATPSCTAALCALRDDIDLIRDLGAAIVAISVDSVESQRAFSREHGGPFPLLSDSERTAARAFGVLDENGKRSRRAVFVSDRQGVIVKAIPHYNPANSQQFQSVFAALSLEIE